MLSSKIIVIKKNEFALIKHQIIKEDFDPLLGYQVNAIK